MKILCSIISLLFCYTSLAQVPLAKDQPAPEEGIFLTKEQAAKVIAEKQSAQQICKINHESSLQQLKVKCEYEKDVLKNELSYEERKYEEISKLRDVQEEKLYDRIGDSGDNLYWFVGGFAVGAAITTSATIGIIMFINQVNP